MSIKLTIKDIELNEIFEYDKISSHIETIKPSNTYVISTKKIYYFDDDDTFKLVPQLDYKKKNKVLTEYLGLPYKKEGVNDDNKAKMNKFLKDKEGHISINISSLNVQNFKHITRVISGLNRLKKQNYDFICFQDVKEFTSEYRIILRQLDMNYIYEQHNELLLLGNFSKYGDLESNRKWNEINTYYKSTNDFSTSGTLFEINKDNNSYNSVFIINCFFKFIFEKKKRMKDTILFGNNLKKNFRIIIEFYKEQLINNNNMLFKDKDFNFIICGNFNNTKYEVIINDILKELDILAHDSCKLVDNPNCSEDTLKSSSLKRRSLINGGLKVDGFFVSNYIHVSDSRVRSDLCHNWSKYKLIELKCFINDSDKSDNFNSLYSLVTDVNFNDHIYHHNLKKYSNSSLNIINYQKNKYEEIVDKNLFENNFVFYLDDNYTKNITQLYDHNKIFNQVKNTSSLSESSKMFYVLTTDINQFKFIKNIISINYYICKYLFTTYNFINFGYKKKSYYIYLDKNKQLNLSILIRSNTDDLFLLENEIKLIYNNVIDILFEESKTNKLILHLISYIFLKINHLNVILNNNNFQKFNLLDIFSDYYNDFYKFTIDDNRFEELKKKNNILKLMDKIKLKNSKLMNEILKSNKYFKKTKKIKYTELNSIKKIIKGNEEILIKINYNLITEDLKCDTVILNSNKQYIKNIIENAEKEDETGFKSVNDMNYEKDNIEYPRLDLNKTQNNRIDDIEKIDSNVILLMVKKLIG